MAPWSHGAPSLHLLQPLMVPNNPIAALCCHQGQVADCHGLPVSAVFIVAKDLIQEVRLE